MRYISLRRQTIMPVLLVLVLLAGCGVVDVIGVWQSANAEEITIEFKDDGSLVEYWLDEPTATYYYTQDGNTLTIDQHVEKHDVTIDGNKLKYMGEVIYRRK